MARQATLTVQLSGSLNEFVQANVGENERFEDASAYVSELIRRDQERSEALAMERLKAELAEAFSAPESSYRILTATEVVARHQ